MEKKTIISEEGTIRLTVDEIDPMERRIIENNNIPKLVPMTLQQMDDWITIRYDVAGKTSLQKVLKNNGSISVEMGIHILKNLLQEVKRLEEYMLLTTHMVLKPEYIFIVLQSKKVEFLYIPYAAVDTKESIEDAVKGILAFLYQGIYMHPQNVVRELKELLDNKYFTMVKLQEVLDGYSSTRNAEGYLPETPVSSMESTEIPNLTQIEEKKKELKGKRGKKQKEKKQAIKDIDEAKLKKNRLAVVFLALMALIITFELSESLEITAGIGLILAMIVFMAWRRMGQHAEQKAGTGADKKAAGHRNDSKETNRDRASIDVFNNGKRPVKQQPSTRSSPFKRKKASVNQNIYQSPVPMDPIPPSEPQVYQAPPQSVPPSDPQAYHAPPQSVTPSASQAFQTPPQSAAPDLSGMLGGAPEPERQIILESVNADQPVRFQIRQDEFVIGKKAKSVDGVIGFNRTVSRRHCKVFYYEGEYFIEDLNSSNGTYLNGARIESQKAVKIEVGDYIRISNMDFIVKESER